MTDMTIEHALPPNFDKILAAIPDVKNYPNAIFCYGAVIYNPAGAELPPWIVAHEEVHWRQQEECGDVEWWWEMYLSMKTFRFDEEVPAYRAQWVEYCRHVKDRNTRLKYLRAIAGELASPIYGTETPLEKAMMLIKGL